MMEYKIKSGINIPPVFLIMNILLYIVEKHYNIIVLHHFFINRHKMSVPIDISTFLYVYLPPIIIFKVKSIIFSLHCMNTTKLCVTEEIVP